MTTILILIFSILCSLGVVTVSGTFLLFPENIRRGISWKLLSYSMGILLSMAFLKFIPDALKNISSSLFFSLLMVAIILLFIIGKIISLKAIHQKENSLDRNVPFLVLTGDFLQNLVEGIAITGMFFQSIPLGIAASLSIFSVQIPQKIVNFAILLESGYSRKRSFIYNSLASLGVLAGSGLSFVFVFEKSNFIPVLLAIAAAAFIYTSIAEIVPKLNSIKELKEDFRQTVLILLGIATILLLEIS